MTQEEKLLKQIERLKEDKKRIYNKMYRLWKPEAKRMDNRRRRAKKKELNENYTHDDETYTRELFSHECFKCESPHDITIDHHLPLSVGFVLSRENAVVLCRSCNSSKGNKLPHDFYTEEELNTLENLLGNL